MVCWHMIAWVLVLSDQEKCAPSPPPVAGSSTLVPLPQGEREKTRVRRSFVGGIGLDGSYRTSLARVRECIKWFASALSPNWDSRPGAKQDMPSIYTRAIPINTEDVVNLLLVVRGPGCPGAELRANRVWCMGIAKCRCP